MLAFAISSVAIAGDTTQQVPWHPGDANLDGVVNMGDVTTTELIILGYLVYLTVESDGCCPIDVSWAGGGGTVAAGERRIFYNIFQGTDVTVSANDSDYCCVFDNWSDSGDQTHDVHMDSDKSVTATCHLLVSDLTVNSCGCCNVIVSGLPGGPHTVPTGTSQTFNDIDGCHDVTVTADPPPECVCDVIELDEPYCACTYPPGDCDPVTIHMDGEDHEVNVCCHGAMPVPEPCCWCIYLAQWWQGEDPPAGDPDNVEYFCLHCEEWLPPGHTENLFAPFPDGVHVIPDPSWHQELSYYAGPPPNGYGVPEWSVIDCVQRFNSILGPVCATGLGYWNSHIDLVNWKVRYDLNTGLGLLVVHAVTLAVVPMSGNAGWPYAVGNSWVSVGMSTITPSPSTSYHKVVGEEIIDCWTGDLDIFPDGIMCYRVEDYSWSDVDGVDIDGDGAVDEDPFNGYDEDGDGKVDEDGGDMVPDPVELTMSSFNWWHNDYGFAIKRETYPGALYQGYENLCLIWYCFDPPFPPWE
jgi:hypothetical protein